MRLDNPEVLVWITCRNYERFRNAARDSALDQTHVCAVQVVHDRCNVWSEMKHRRPQGPSHMRNLCVNYLSASSISGYFDYVVFLDADDTIPRDYVAKLLAVAKGDRCVVACDAEMVGEETGRIEVRRPITLRSLLEGNSIHAAALVPFEVFRVHSFDEKLPSHEDWDLWCKMLVAGVEFRYCPDTALIYNRHSDGRSAKTRHMYGWVSEEIRRRYSRIIPHAEKAARPEPVEGGLGSASPA